VLVRKREKIQKVSWNGMMRKGIFVTFEGIDGCGKTTQLERAKETLEKKGVPCLVTREPGGTLIGEKIRDIILSPEHDGMCGSCEALLYLAARAQHVNEIILPALREGAVVLCDRFSDATFAYQGNGRKLPVSVLEKMNGFATTGAQPSLTFLFDISVAISRRRLALSGKTVDRLEGSGAGFYEDVRSGYLSLAKRFPRRIIVLSGERPIEELSEIVCSRILKKINKNM
jgi:dTMP kinase